MKEKSKYEFLKRCRVLALCQGACQVIIVVADSVEWWNGFTILLGETCSFFRVLCLSVMFYQTCNLTAMTTVYLEHPEGNEKKVPFPKVRIFAALCRTDSTESQSATDTSLSAWRFWKENMMPMVSGVPHSESLLYKDLEEVAIFNEVMLSVITKFAVGIVIPVTLHDLINSSYSGQQTLNCNCICFITGI